VKRREEPSIINPGGMFIYNSQSVSACRNAVMYSSWWVLRLERRLSTRVKQMVCQEAMGA
jgi:hypothetical protein